MSEKHDQNWCRENPSAAAVEIELLKARILEVETILERLRDGTDIILPQDRDHANYMHAVAAAYFEEHDD